MYLLDTDVLIDIQRGYTPAITWFASLSEVPSIAGFVAMELIQDAKNKQQVRKALQLVAPLTIVCQLRLIAPALYPILRSIIFPIN